MRHGHALALDGVHAHGRRVQEDVDDVVVEEVDLVDIQDVAVCLGQNAGLKTPRPFLERRLEVDGADHPVFGSVDRQLDHTHAPRRHGQRPARCPFPAVETPVLGVVGMAPEVAALDDLLVGQQARQRAHRSRLPGSLLTPNEHASDRRVDGVEHEGELHLVLSDDRREGVGVPVERHAWLDVTDAHWQVTFVGSKVNIHP